MASNEELRDAAVDRHPSVAEKLRWFEFEHLPAGLMRDTSEDVADVALAMVQHLIDCPQLSLGLQHLIDAKDCLVRAAIATKEDADRPDDGDALTEAGSAAE